MEGGHPTDNPIDPERDEGTLLDWIGWIMGGSFVSRI